MAKVDRRVARTQDAIKTAFLELMSEKNFDSITIQDISDRANVNRATVYLHYLDKYDLLDKIIEEHIQNMASLCEEDADMEWIEATVHCMEYLKSNYLFFSTMLTTEGAQYFRSRFVQYNMEEFKKEVDITTGKNLGQNEEIVAEFVANAYVGVVEWWIKNGMPYSSEEMAEKVGDLLERII
ncbi:TetR/AcrR family transcriptional regulator C-terminal domain-containing protein [Fictibacillus sp. B-59209]|uniref:TetR/AcrR family transcriptional regulator C-terminal domain-containing protein n=1 Tax=Fictibacillus sp. B-59209 TaxID=3024873 RepID=UPI002E1E4490|nr:TetR/AcrR family transcriptional regulator C-terminal domain-containing protein [Fictibacillus sp. B-59209]